jgi:hypothetical protein
MAAGSRRWRGTAFAGDRSLGWLTLKGLPGPLLSKPDCRGVSSPSALAAEDGSAFIHIRPVSPPVDPGGCSFPAAPGVIELAQTIP